MSLFYLLVFHNILMHIWEKYCACHPPDRRLGTAVVTSRIPENTKLHDSGIYTYNSIIWYQF